MAEQPNDHLRRALEAQPHHHLGADAAPAQMMRQPVGALIELAIAQRGVLEHHRGRPRACATACAANSSGSVAGDRMGGVVPAPQQRLALAGRQNVERPDRTPRLRNRRLQQPDEPRRQRLHARPDRTGRWRIRSPRNPGGRAVEPRALRPGSPTSRTWRSPSPPAQSSPSVPKAPAAAAALFCNASITWNSGWRASERAGLSTSTSRSNGSSWWL